MDKLLVICGPTATGKTKLAVELAKKFNGELISADSRQVYRGMDIGTGKDLSELEGANIHLLDVVDPAEPFSVSQYQQLARSAMSDIRSRARLPIIVGGTGLYIDSLTNNFASLTIPPDEQLRNTLEKKSVIELQEALRCISRQTLDSLNNSDKYNPRRLIRKIEILSQKTGKAEGRSMIISQVLSVGLTLPFDALRENIQIRVDKRVNSGQLNEIRTLLSKGYSWDLPSMSALGYIQWREVIENNLNARQAIDEWKKKEFQYAKRQLTWFRKNKSIEWFDVSEGSFAKKIDQRVSAWYTN